MQYSRQSRALSDALLDNLVKGGCVFPWLALEAY